MRYFSTVSLKRSSAFDDYDWISNRTPFGLQRFRYAYIPSLARTQPQPDPVDDVIRNILPGYNNGAPPDHTYSADIARILHAFKTDSEGQKEKLKAVLRMTPFVRAVDAKSGASSLAYPEHVYLAAARLKELFAGVAGVVIVDDRQECLRGEDVRELLEAGALRAICFRPKRQIHY